ncbi:hypothetical protein [Flavobacterium reichenbachii]|uniref:Uncharacterized protein n=1 Tax=Flavobacterium reichenbachii TaxID=362418 RepID=A0A085ZSK5_9FLAO|nr:hypothetical protein [Flavobacterium reichenbachii]KFF07419.1 hypothetical protein IW19_18745 [Flavobacterium reichenbachii]OXB13100.1 hypothetical protein B0A68_15105 [Flavobacterium reichenbachii]
MSTNLPQNHENQEIDIFQLSKSIGSFFDRVSFSIFKAIQFFIRNWIIVLVLVILGFGLGWYLDSNKKTFKNQIIVTPNFGSVDYLYTKIDLIQAKIASGDTVFLKNTIGISRPEALKKIEIKPLADVYKFIQDREQNLELIKIMAEVGDVKKILEDNVTSKNYTFHTINFVSNTETDEKDIEKPLLKYLNNSAYFAEVQKAEFENLQKQITQNDTIISQINTVLNGFSNTVKNTAKNDKLVYYNENTQLNDIIKTKQNLIIDQGKNRLKLISYDKTIKDINAALNINDTKFTNGIFKFVIPFIFIFIFVCISLFQGFYRKQLLKTQTR